MLHCLLLLRLLGKVQKQKEWVSGITSGVVMIQLLLLLWLKWAILPPYIFFLHLVQSLHHTDFHFFHCNCYFSLWCLVHLSFIYYYFPDLISFSTSHIQYCPTGWCCCYRPCYCCSIFGGCSNNRKSYVWSNWLNHSWQFTGNGMLFLLVPNSYFFQLCGS